MDFESSLRAPPVYHATVITDALTADATARRRRRHQPQHVATTTTAKLPVLLTARTTTRTLERLPALAGEAFLRDVTECIRTGQPIASTARAVPTAAAQQQQPATSRQQHLYLPVPLPPIARSTKRSDVRRQQLDRAVAEAATNRSVFAHEGRRVPAVGASASIHHSGRPEEEGLQGDGTGAAAAAGVVRGVSPSLLRASSSRAAARIVGARRKQATSKRRGPEWMEFAANDIMHSECVENARLLIARADHLQRTSMLQFASNQMHAGNRRKSQAGDDGGGGNRYTRQAEMLRQQEQKGSTNGHGNDASGGVSPVSPC